MKRHYHRLAFISLLSCAGSIGAQVNAPSSVLAPAAVVAGSEGKEAAVLAQAMRQTSQARRDYRISPGDLIDVAVYGDQELSRKARVGQNGKISMPLVGSILIGGLPLLDAEDAVREKLRKFYIDPHVTLFIQEYGAKQVFVLGEVQKPGTYRIPSETRMTVLEAISTAGGFTPVAGLDRTRILRSVQGKNQIISIKVTAITKQGEKDRDVELQPDDVVFVPQSYF
ncbi:MAG: polysaccharide biosynthesis/export family protein [Elusimicrobia bacterium]|nr:polysaccharide biosynthesis/export family protein [Elusimicrobiota bacterium]